MELAAAARLALAAVLVAAAVAKLGDRPALVRTLALTPLSDAAVRRLALLLPPAELVLAVGLVLPWRPVQLLALLATTALLAAFTSFLAHRDPTSVGGCRCFGPRATRRSVAIARNAALIGLLLLPLGHAEQVLSAVAAAGLGVLGYAVIAALPPRPPDLHLAVDTFVVFVEAGCEACEELLDDAASWAGGPPVRFLTSGSGEGHQARAGVVVEPVPARVLDRFGVKATPSAALVSPSGQLLDGNHRPGARLAVGPGAVRERWRLAVQGHDLPLPPDAGRTLLVFADRATPAALLRALAAEPAVVVLAAGRLRQAPTELRVRADPGGATAAVFGARATSAVLVDQRGRPLRPVLSGADAVSRGVRSVMNGEASAVRDTR